MIADCNDSLLSSVVAEAVHTMEECFTKFPPESVSVCFNGGKDCVVMLHIVHAVHQKLFPEKKMKSFYVSEERTFSEVDTFMATTIETYKLDNKTYQQPMKVNIGWFRILTLSKSIEFKSNVLFRRWR